VETGMKKQVAASARQAGRLLRWYPKQWRSRYGAEFLELLDAEIKERPWSWRRNLDVAFHGLSARLTASGLTRHLTEPQAQAGARLASAGCALAISLACGASMWAQLAIGWRWSEPDTRATYTAMFVMSIAMLLVCTLLVMAAIPVAWRVVKSFAQGNSRLLVGPLSLFLVGASVLVTGSRHFENGWPGTGGHPWSAQGLVPGGVAAFTWASTLWITSYWAHPQVLFHFPVAELAWMVISPIATVCAVIGGAKTIRRVELPRRTLHFETQLARVAGVAMLALLIGSASWTAQGGSGPHDLFRTGGIDIAALGVMSASLAVAYLAVRRPQPARDAFAGS
jgi:hypothetical protein